MNDGRAEPRGRVYELYREGCRRLDAGDPSGAVEVLERAVEAEPAKASLREALARACFATSRIRRARREFKRALELDPSDPYAHFGVGRTYERQGRLSEAAKHFKLACALSPCADYEQAVARVARRAQHES